MLTLWYSEEQRAHLGRVWRYRSTAGNLVLCTLVTATPDHHAGWADLVKVGEAETIESFVDVQWEDRAKKQAHETQMQDIPMPYEFRRHGPAFVLPDPEE